MTPDEARKQTERRLRESAQALQAATSNLLQAAHAAGATDDELQAFASILQSLADRAPAAAPSTPRIPT